MSDINAGTKPHRDTPLSEVFSGSSSKSRVRYCLEHAGFKTLGEAHAAYIEDPWNLKGIRNFGKTSLRVFLEVVNNLEESAPSLSRSEKSLRDWFAGQALQGLLANPQCIDMEGRTPPPAEVWRVFAGLSYAHADAMLKARELGSEGRT